MAADWEENIDGAESYELESEDAFWTDGENDFTDWNEAAESDETQTRDERLEKALARERSAELENEIEQDEYPRDYDVEPEDEEEEAAEERSEAPADPKRLKREIRLDAIRRLEEAARTPDDFDVVIDEWDKLDRNRERRERDHENLRGDVPLEFQAVPDPRITPRWMNNPAYRQLCSGNFLDILFDCPFEMHELTADRFISKMIRKQSDDHKEIFYFLALRLYSTVRLGEMRGQSDRNIRKIRVTIKRRLQKQLYEHLCIQQDTGNSLTLREKEFVNAFAAELEKSGKAARIKAENKTRPRKKKAVLDESKHG